MNCDENGCEAPAVYQYTWPDTADTYVGCDRHAQFAATQVAMMGRSLALNPIELERGSRDTTPPPPGSAVADLANWSTETLWQELERRGEPLRGVAVEKLWDELEHRGELRGVFVDRKTGESSSAGGPNAEPPA